MSSCQHICMYTGHRISVPDKPDYCNDGEWLLACVLAPLSHCPPAPFSTSSPGHFVLRAGCSLPRPRQARVALPAILNPDVPEGYTTRTRSLLDLSRLLQYKKQKAHQAAAAWSSLRRFSIMIMQPLRIGLTLSTPASLPFRSIGKSAKAVFAFQSPIPTGNNGSAPLIHAACRRKSKRPAFAALHHCRHCRSCRFGKSYNMSLSRCATAEERTSSAIFTCGVQPPSLFLQGRYTLSASPRHHCCHVSCNLKKHETRQQLRKALALRS
jgi:hypothetical protein